MVVALTPCHAKQRRLCRSACVGPSASDFGGLRPQGYWRNVSARLLFLRITNKLEDVGLASSFVPPSTCTMSITPLLRRPPTDTVADAHGNSGAGSKTNCQASDNSRPTTPPGMAALTHPHLPKSTHLPPPLHTSRIQIYVCIIPPCPPHPHPPTHRCPKRWEVQLRGAAESDGGVEREENTSSPVGRWAGRCTSWRVGFFVRTATYTTPVVRARGQEGPQYTSVLMHFH